MAVHGKSNNPPETYRLVDDTGALRATFTVPASTTLLDIYIQALGELEVSLMDEADYAEFLNPDQNPNQAT